MNLPRSMPDTITALKCELAAEVLRSSGKLRLQVMGWSMLPSIFPGDTLLIERAKDEEISRGDIVLFHRQDRFFVHRVVIKPDSPDKPQRNGLQTGPQQIVTQGDGIAWPDPPVNESQVLGKISFIVRKGRLIESRKNLDFSQRAVSMLVRRSSSAARLVAGIHGMRRSTAEADQPCRI